MCKYISLKPCRVITNLSTPTILVTIMVLPRLAFQFPTQPQDYVPNFHMAMNFDQSPDGINSRTAIGSLYSQRCHS